MKMTVFWDVAPCSLVEVYRRLRGAIALMMEAESTSETSVNFYDTTHVSVVWCSIKQRDNYFYVLSHMFAIGLKEAMQIGVDLNTDVTNYFSTSIPEEMKSTKILLG
jgi:hypothetical protein